jgi:hypothetical protein
LRRRGLYWSQCVEVGGATSGRPAAATRSPSIASPADQHQILARAQPRRESLPCPSVLCRSTHPGCPSPLPCPLPPAHQSPHHMVQPSRVTSRTFPAARPAPRYIRTANQSRTLFFRPSQDWNLKPRFQEATFIRTYHFNVLEYLD